MISGIAQAINRAKHQHPAMSNFFSSSSSSGPRSSSAFGNVGDGFEFKRTAALDQRRTISERIRTKYPDRVPMIIERVPGAASLNTPKGEKSKFLVSAESPVAHVLVELRKQLRLKPEQSLFLFVGNGVLPPTAALVSHIYERFKDEDGFLYLAYASENTFGAPLLFVEQEE